MLSLIGGGLICITASYGGFYFADRLRKRYDFLRNMKSALLYISSQIEFGRYELRRIFSHIEDNPSLFGFFSMCADKIYKDGIEKAWSASLCSVSTNAFLKEPETEALFALSKELGKSDVSGQKKAIALCVNLIDMSLESAKDEYERLSKTYRGCGILLGVFFLIIFA